MPESVSFWLENKMASAHKIAELGDQILVDYRGKFYVIKNGSALMKGSRPLRYSKTSMPALWKKALRGDIPSTFNAIGSEEENLPNASVNKKVRRKKEVEKPPVKEASTAAALKVTQVSEPGIAPKKTKVARRGDSKPVTQTAVAAQCPYCDHKQDIPVEKGKNGKPFFFACFRCSGDFAVRFVSVTLLQAQTAAFK